MNKPRTALRCCGKAAGIEQEMPVLPLRWLACSLLTLSPQRQTKSSRQPACW